VIGILQEIKPRSEARIGNTRADWSFGNGEAQFMNGKLK